MPKLHMDYEAITEASAKQNRTVASLKEQHVILKKALDILSDSWQGGGSNVFNANAQTINIQALCGVVMVETLTSQALSTKQTFQDTDKGLSDMFILK